MAFDFPPSSTESASRTSLPGYANTVIGDLLSEVSHLDERIKQYDAHIRAMARDCTLAQRLMQLIGVGETTSTALVAMIGNASDFDSGVSVLPSPLDGVHGMRMPVGDQASGFDQRCGSSSSMRLFGWPGSRSSTSRK